MRQGEQTHRAAVLPEAPLQMLSRHSKPDCNACILQFKDF